MTTNPEEPLTDPDVVPSGDPGTSFPTSDPDTDTPPEEQQPEVVPL